VELILLFILNGSVIWMLLGFSGTFVYVGGCVGRYGRLFCLKRKDKEMIKKVFLLVVFISLLAGCRTKYVAVPTVQIRDSIVTKVQRDSVALHDSVFVNTYTRGDTVFVDKVKAMYLYKDRLRVDTVAVVKRDTVTQVIRETTSAGGVISGAKGALKWLLWVVIAFVGLFVGCRVIKAKR